MVRSQDARRRGLLNGALKVSSARVADHIGVDASQVTRGPFSRVQAQASSPSQVDPNQRLVAGSVGFARFLRSVHARSEVRLC